jgi:hypothetical protein
MGPKFFALWAATETAINTLWGVFFMTHLMIKMSHEVLAWQDTVSAVVYLIAMLGLARYLNNGKNSLTDRVPIEAVLMTGQILGLCLVLLYLVVSLDTWRIVNIMVGGAFAPIMNTAMMELRVQHLQSDIDRRACALLTKTWSSAAQIGAGVIGGLLFMHEQPVVLTMLILIGIGVVVPIQYIAAKRIERAATLLVQTVQAE